MDEKKAAEQQYKRTVKKLKTISVLLLPIGIGLIGFGIYSLVTFLFFPMGTFILFFGAVCLMISLFLFLISKGREIGNFQAQTVVPIQNKMIEGMAPTVAKTSGMVAKEVYKGIREVKFQDAGTKGEESVKEEGTVYCKHCGSVIDGDSTFCRICGKEQ